jgi:predicted TPR repeat methyltransferase
MGSGHVYPSSTGSLGTILDLGCGHGALVHLARQAGYRNIRGVDVAPEQVAAAKRLGIDEVVQKDLMETLRSLADEAQDCIVAFDEDGRQHQG